MPSFYAHDRFGTALLDALPADIRRTVTRFPQLFRVGLQGPDFFFYYNPVFRTAIGALGSSFHHQSGMEFFTHAAQAADTEAGQAYLWGLLGHYCLDSQCHPFIHAQTDSGPIRHVELEAEFERFLLTLDGEASPETYPRGKKMKLTRGECVTVAAFYPPAGPEHINRAVKNTAWCLKMVCLPHGAMRRFVTGVIKNAGDSVAHQMVPSRAEPKFRLLNEQMLALYEQALARYPVLLEKLRDHMANGTPLDTDFTPTFG